MNLRHNALEVLKETSRTFYIPISMLPSGLLEAVASAYLCMRAIDEVEDSPSNQSEFTSGNRKFYRRRFFNGSLPISGNFARCDA